MNLKSFVDIAEGWNDRIDPAKAPGFRVMENVMITDRGGIAPRPGTELFGAASSGSDPVVGLHTMKKRDGTNVMIRASGTDLQYYNTLTSAFATLSTAFTSGKDFGFEDHNINTDALDYVYGGNAYEAYFRWVGAFGKTTSVLVGGETTIPVDSTLLDDVYFSGTASATTTTTLTIAASSWATDLWNNFYIEITSGAASGQIRLITATTATQLTFASIGALAGTPTFKIRRAKYPNTGTVRVNSTEVAYTALQTSTDLPVASAPAAASGSPVSLVLEFLPGNSCPRGNILKTLFQVMFVSGTKDHPSTIYRSKLQNAADFRYSSTRVAGEGDFIDLPEGGGRIYDIETFEDTLIALKESYIESISFTQDANDLPIRKPIVKSPLIGTKGRVARMGDDIMFVSPANEITTLSRVKDRDTRPLSSNLAWPIKRGIRNFVFDSKLRIRTYKNYTFVACKRTSASTGNDLVIVLDNNLQKWIGVWNLPAAAFTDYNSELYFGSSATNEVYKMLTDNTSTVKGTTVNGYDTRVETNWVNKTTDGMSTQEFDLLEITGYIKQNTPVEFALTYDFKTEPAHTWIFDPATSPNNILENSDYQVLGINPLGVVPLSVTIEPDEGDFGEQRFHVVYRLPPNIHTWVKLSWVTSGSNRYYEFTDIKANFRESETKFNQALVKSIEDT